MTASQNTTITPTLIRIIESESDETFLGLAPPTMIMILIFTILVLCGMVWVLIISHYRLRLRIATLKQFRAVDQASFVAPLPQHQQQQNYQQQPHSTRPSNSYLYAHGRRERDPFSRDVSRTYHTQNSKPQSNTRVCESDPEHLLPSPHNLTVNRVHCSAPSHTNTANNNNHSHVSATHTSVNLFDCNVEDEEQKQQPIKNAIDHDDDALLNYIGLSQSQKTQTAVPVKVRDNYKPSEKFLFPTLKTDMNDSHHDQLRKFKPRGGNVSSLTPKARDSLIVHKLLKAAKHSPAPAPPLAVNRNVQNTTNANMIRRPCKILRSGGNNLKKAGPSSSETSTTSSDATYQTSSPSSSLMSSHTGKSLSQCDDARSSDETVQTKIIDVDDEFDKENETENVRNSVMEYKYCKFFDDAKNNRLEYDLGRKMSRSTSNTGQNPSCTQKTMIIHADDSICREYEEETDSMSSLPRSSYQNEGMIAHIGNGTVEYYD